MAATVLIREKNGAGETATDKTSGTVRFKKADDANVDANNPLVKASAPDRSFEKWLRLNFSVAPTGQITNPKFYPTTAPGTGITMYVRTTNPGTYSTPAVPANDSAGTDSATFNSGSAKALDVANAGPFTGTGDKGDYCVLWYSFTSSIAAPQNPSTTVTLNFVYDET